jgi:hypothetical protein
MKQKGNTRVILEAAWNVLEEDIHSQGHKFNMEKCCGNLKCSQGVDCRQFFSFVRVIRDIKFLLDDRPYEKESNIRNNYRKPHRYLDSKPRCDRARVIVTGTSWLFDVVVAFGNEDDSRYVEHHPNKS